MQRNVVDASALIAQEHQSIDAGYKFICKNRS